MRIERFHLVGLRLYLNLFRSYLLDPLLRCKAFFCKFQLALYRQAYSRITGIAPELIDAVFYYVADDAVIRPDRLYSESELEDRWSSVTGSMPR